MKLKLNEDGNVVVVEGKPVYIDDDEKEIEVDVPQLFGKITQLNGESKGHRERAEALTVTLEPFKGIDDVSKWKTDADAAIEKVKNFSDKDLIEAGKVDQIKAEMKAAHDEEKSSILSSFSEKEGTFQEALKKKDGTIYKLMVSAKFAQSPYFAGDKPKTLLTPEIAEAYFGTDFKVEGEGDEALRVVGYVNGNQIYSRKNPGELADFDEALDAIITAYPMKDKILRASSGGSGGQGGDDETHDREKPGDLKKLEEQYKEAAKSGRMTDAIAIKNKMHAIRQKAANAA